MQQNCSSWQGAPCGPKKKKAYFACRSLRCTCRGQHARPCLNVCTFPNKSSLSTLSKSCARDVSESMSVLQAQSEFLEICSFRIASTLRSSCSRWGTSSPFSPRASPSWASQPWAASWCGRCLPLTPAPAWTRGNWTRVLDKNTINGTCLQKCPREIESVKKRPVSDQPVCF
jgi:hypothetical protein